MLLYLTRAQLPSTCLSAGTSDNSSTTITMADMAPKKTAVDIQDESRLAQLGYKQELKRDWTLMHNFGVSFSIIVRVGGHLGMGCS
jgi:hypothetical protein